MRTSNPDRLTAATAEQLLDGGPGPAGLQQLLAAAAGPGAASELTGESAAVAAFVGAPRETSLPSAPTRRPSMLSTALSKILAAKALAAVVLLAGATGGVALAANASSAPSSTDEAAATSTATAAPEPADEDRDADSGSTAAPDANSPEPSIIGLCRAWAAGATENPGKAAENPAFRSLVEAAGSEADVPGFCSVREKVDEPGKSGTAPGHAADRPGAAGSSAGQGGPPTAAPGNPDHPAGPPAGRADKGGDEESKDNNGKNDEDDKGGAEKNGDEKGGDARDADSQGGRDESKQGGGASADHRPTS
ncbi:hypothetical protein [Pseudonocardia cypriaca]|uniref:Uncharacterized protein n=1 Tax=Pseudonocardia cypriaca TaxID=882449 RepID=A0A543FVA1_9PSEU|nr:hypothetical protein [Pseudonocardia cypriaca]TQM37788.1 hypothetical protein FB388_5007 [Pseudonocardia cypriaca]